MQLGQGQPVRVDDRIRLELPTVRGERLAEIPAAIEQPHADDGHAQVAGRLEVVAGQDAQTTGVLRKHRCDPVLRREVPDRDRWRVRASCMLRLKVLVPARCRQVVLQVLVREPHPLGEVVVTRERLQPVRRHRTEQLYRVVVDLVPDLRVDGGEQVAGGRVPGPTQVGAELTERGQWFGQRGSDGEPADGAHGGRA